MRYPIGTSLPGKDVLMLRSSLIAALLPTVAFAFACSSTPTPEGAGPTLGPVSARPDFDAMVRGGDCLAASGEAIEHGGDITTDEVWAAGVHKISSNVRVLATVTVEACAKVEIGDSRTIQVGSSPTVGKLVLRGSREGGKLLPVRFTAQETSRPWGAIVVDGTGSLDATLAVLEGGDSVTAQQNGGGMLRVFGKSSTSDGGTPSITKNLRSDWLLVQGAKASGIALLRYAGFSDDSTGVAIRGSEGESLRTEIGASSALPTELFFSGNAKNEVLLEQTWSGTLSTTVRAKGVPYRIDGALYLAPVEDGAPAVLTVEPGVTVRFGAAKGSSGIYVGTSETRQGQIVAKGTADAPVRFTSAKDVPAAGDWMGLYFRSYPTSGNAIENAVVEYAGGESAATGFGCGPRDNDATILLLGARPTSAFVQGTTLRSGGGNAGIVLGWKSDESGPDFLSGNRFESMPACSVSRPRGADNACPGSGEPVCL
jgi:hypothetical protein